jgi:hypothetical protein
MWSGKLKLRAMQARRFLDVVVKLTHPWTMHSKLGRKSGAMLETSCFWRFEDEREGEFIYDSCHTPLYEFAVRFCTGPNKLVFATIELCSIMSASAGRLGDELQAAGMLGTGGQHRSRGEAPAAFV